MEVTYNRHGSCHKHDRNMKVTFVYRVGQEEHTQEVEIIGPRLDHSSLLNYWKSAISNHVPQGAEFIRAYYNIDLGESIRGVPQMTGYYRMTFSRVKNGEREYMTVDSTVMMIPAPLESDEINKLAEELLAIKGLDEEGYRLAWYTFVHGDVVRKPKPVWVKVRDDGPEFLRWIPGLLYDRGTVLTAIGTLSNPDSEDDTRDFSDIPFNGCEIRSV